ncbi:phosphoethanolamine transferase [Glaciimonas sp. PAMC28666]|uniref:phosphoethanolamine transferase n=1 Tax=Glaciimonas sp. PAMC28666 TaxID=2807626 RepID=UPI0019663D78|nr:phosphoethanolamine transferase [Glaciimonas sp. PAMC28666]QRX84450.1 phosphoethanolamine transferase [Glaciimonas sp. PAMC28666]
MSQLLHRNNLFVLITYFILSLVPFAPWLFGQVVDRPGRIVAIEFIAWVTVWALAKRPALFHWLLLPAFIALPVELYLRKFYGQGISTHHLGIIAETTPAEAIEFLGNKIWLLAFLVVFILLWWALSWVAAWRTRDLDWHGRSRWVCCLLAVAAFSIWLYGDQVGIKPSPFASLMLSQPLHKSPPASVNAAAKSAPLPAASAGHSTNLAVTPKPAALASAAGAPHKCCMLPSWASVPFQPEPFGATWPFGLAVRGYDFWKEHKYLEDLQRKNRNFAFGAHQVSQQETPQIVVMVIGESSRYDRWSLNGYARETNPLLKQEPNLVSFSDVLTGVAATRLSVPVMISRKPILQSLRAGFSEKSFITAYKEAGFKTYWISNQMSFGKFDTPISVFANEADVTQFINLGGFTDTSSFDQALLSPLQSAIHDPHPKKLIVLHTLGSHWNYSHRYPKEFDQWQPSLFGVSNPAYTNLANKPALNNSYDSSVLYTDWFLEQVIKTLKSTNALTAMMYFSDHGETLYDGSCKIAFHGHNTQFEFHIPGLMWYSDLYKAAYPEKVEQLIRHKRARINTENVFHSLLDLSDIRYPDEHLERSFLSSKLRPQKRYVDSYGWSDYDNSTFKGDCREVKDNSKPLVQLKD